jgi:hypothetical protein
MAGLPWIPLAVDFPDSRKAVALGVALGNPLAWAYVVRLWTWAARNAQDGRVEGPDAVAVIEHAACWNGSPGAFVEAASLPHIALLDHTERGFSVHDWADHCGAHVEKREKDRARMRASRKRNRSRTVREPSTHVPGEREKETERETEIPHVLPMPARRRAGGEGKLGPLASELRLRVEQGLNHGLIPLGSQAEADELEQLVEAFGGVEVALAFVAGTCRKRDADPQSMAWMLTVLRPSAGIGRVP